MIAAHRLDENRDSFGFVALNQCCPGFDPTAAEDRQAPARRPLRRLGCCYEHVIMPEAGAQQLPRVLSVLDLRVQLNYIMSSASA